MLYIKGMFEINNINNNNTPNYLHGVEISFIFADK